MAKILLIRADAGAEIGAGHVMRSIALAQAWQRSGGGSIFALAAGAELEPRIRGEGADFARIRAVPGTREDAIQTAELCGRWQADWLVVDGYHFSPEYRNSMRRAASRLLLVDDGEEPRGCECDVVVNPDPDASAAMYPDRDAQTVYLPGPQYALLRREFLGARAERADPPEMVKQVLVSMGGGDPNNVTLQVVDALEELSDLDLQATVVVGPSYRHVDALQAVVARFPGRARLLRNVQNMPELMTQADLAITAGGGTCYELAYMRVPMFLITMAENHERAVRALAAAGAAMSVGWFSSLGKGALAAALRGVICDRDLRMKLAQSAARMVDGRGAERVVETMLALCQQERKVTA